MFLRLIQTIQKDLILLKTTTHLKGREDHIQIVHNVHLTVPHVRLTETTDRQDHLMAMTDHLTETDCNVHHTVQDLRDRQDLLTETATDSLMVKGHHMERDHLTETDHSAKAMAADRSAETNRDSAATNLTVPARQTVRNVRLRKQERKSRTTISKTKTRAGSAK